MRPGWLTIRSSRRSGIPPSTPCGPSPWRAVALAGFVIGATNPLILPAVAAILVVGLLAGRSGPAAMAADENRAPAQALMLTAAGGGLAFAFMLAFGVLGSGLSPRYLIPVAPPLLLCVTLVARAGRHGRLTCAALIALYLGIQVGPVLDVFGPSRSSPRYEFERGSAYLMAHGVTDVVFVWDHEFAPIMRATTLAEVGGVFFQRADRAVRVRPLVVDPGRDANPDIVAAAQGARPGLIWLFNRQGRTAAHSFAPAIDRDPHWICAEQGDAVVGGLACYRRPDMP